MAGAGRLKWDGLVLPKLGGATRARLLERGGAAIGFGLGVGRPSGKELDCEPRFESEDGTTRLVSDGLVGLLRVEPSSARALGLG